ncbi:hypothetical protein GGI14_001154 [Coemansia sp. S680]|nr:hypothetical protein GGI14_001154 [Coemansia sp. S680]
MFAGIKLLWLVAGKVLTAITIQFDNFDPFDEPYDPEPLVTSRFLRQLYLNDNNSSVPRTGGITHIPDGEADDDGSDDDVDNSDAGLPRLRVDNEADVKVSGQRTQVDDAGADVNLSGERTQAIDTSVDTILPEQRALDDDASAATGPLPDTSHIDMAALAQSFGQAGAEGNTLLANNLGPGNGTAFDNSAELGALLLSLGDQWLSNYNATGGNVQIANSSVTDALVPNLANMGGGDDAQLPNDADASALLLSLGNPQTNNSAGTGGNAQAGHYPGLANPGDTQLLSDADASALLLSLGLTSTGDNTIFAGNTGTGANQWFNNNPINVGNMPVAGNMGSAAPEYNGVFMNMDDMVTYYNGLPVAEQAQLFNQAPSGNQAPAMPIADTALLGNNMLFGNNPGADTLQLNFDSLSAGANMFDNNPGVDAFNLDYGAGILPLGPLLPGLDLPPNPVVHGNFNDGANDFFQETGILAAPGILGQDNTAVGDAGNAAEVPNDILNFDALLGWANNIDEETLAQVDAHLAAVGYKFEGEQQPMPTMITAPTTPVDSTGTHESGGGPNV